MMSNSLWIFNHYASDGKTAGGSRHLSLARKLIKLGWDVTIFASGTVHKGKGSKLDTRENFRIEVVEGVRFVWLKTRAYNGNGIARILNMADYYRTVKKNSLKLGLDRPQIIIGSSVHPLAALAAYQISRVLAIPFVFEVRDLWPQTLIDMGALKKHHPFAFLLRRLERFLYRKSKKIITLLPGAHRYISRYKIDVDKVVWISNGVDLESFDNVDKSYAHRNSKPFELMYLGSHGQANGLDVLIRAMKVVVSEIGDDVDVVLRLYGTGPAKNKLIALANSLQLTNRVVFFEDPVPRYEVPEISITADGFVITVLDLPKLYQYGVSMNKIFDYMATGRPTIIAMSAFNNPIEEAGAGITVKPNDVRALAQGIRELIELPEDARVRMGNQARQHVAENYSYEVLARRLHDLLQSLLVK